LSRLKPKSAFDHCAAEYARYRPGYPVGVFQVLEGTAGAPAGRLAADVGAGTGIFSRLLSARGWRVVAVDPSEAMLKRLSADESRTARRSLPVCATAEATGLAASMMMLVTAAQAFHWFNPPYALAEFARILQPGGVLALVWNNRDPARSRFVTEYEALISRYNPAYQREYRQQDWPAKIAATQTFEPAHYHWFDHTWQVSAEGFVGCTRSVSYIRNVLSRQERPRFEQDLRQLLRTEFGHGPCLIPLRTDMWTARRI
jgi:SAM-dependent methyltransferase